APTAAAQKSNEDPLTYLNRGQLYAIHLNDNHCTNRTLSSTFALMFHNSAHRKVTFNYWKFWVSQQRATKYTRVVELDTSQSVGIQNVKLLGFDRVSFDWNGQQGATIYIKFNCLSTDFSRIKGVKGIPMRAYMETTEILNERQDAPFTNNTGAAVDHSGAVESCYCKIKLFRDKGAERKVKDDTKQISRHLEKIFGKQPSLYTMTHTSISIQRRETIEKIHYGSYTVRKQILRVYFSLFQRHLLQDVYLPLTILLKNKTTLLHLSIIVQ
ncbi:CP2 transcription factor-domain-containing protein, partial [Spinellus fusiger]